MAQKLLKLAETVESQLPSVPLTDGQLVFVKDTRQLKWDVDSQRLDITDTIFLETDAEREELLTPLDNKVYVVKETQRQWFWTGTEWKELKAQDDNIVKIVRQVAVPIEGWTGDAAPYSLTLNVEGVTADTVNTIKISKNPTVEELSSYQEANLIDGGQGDGYITLLAYGFKPSVPFDIDIMIDGLRSVPTIDLTKYMLKSQYDKQLRGVADDYLIEIPITLLSTGWSGKTYTITDSRITSNTDADLEVAANISDDAYNQITEAQLSRTITVNTGSLVITVLNEVPTIDIPLMLKVRQW